MRQCCLVLRLFGLLLLVGCSVDARPVPINRQTATALAPQVTVPPAPTRTQVPTLEPTIEPSIQPTSTAIPTVQASQGPADVSYCRREFGPANGARFAARLDGVRTEQTNDFEQVTFVFAETTGSLHGVASCMLAAGWPLDADIGAAEPPGDAIIAVNLEDWAHDDLFASSLLTETAEITPSGVLERVSFAANSLESRGALLGIGLSEPRPFRVRVQGDELIVEIARDATYPPEDDPLGQATGDAAALTQPVFFLNDGDVFRLQNGRAQPVVQTPELEIGVALSPDGTLLAVCRAPADSEPFALPYEVRATLWTMGIDGGNQQQLADAGGCADPVFAPSGKTIAFSANVAPSPPAVLHVLTVPVVGGEATPVAALDEWSRSRPQWLADGRLLYRADNESGQSVIFVRNTAGEEAELTAAILTGATYDGVGQFVVNRATNQIALEALRAVDDGADLVVLRDDGSQVAVEQRGFWQRPLAFTGQGLVYLTAECPSESVLRYTIQRRPAQGSIETLASGSTASGIGSATALEDMLVYVRTDLEDEGVRGPEVEPQFAASSSIWTLSLDGSTRAEAYRADGSIAGLTATEP